MRAGVDTNVVFSGITDPSSGAGGVIAGWLTGQFCPCVSTALALEYEEVLGGKLGARRALRALILLGELLRHAEYVDILVATRPFRDPDDDFVIDCAFNAGAVIVTENLRDFRGVEESVGVRVLTPRRFLAELTEA